MCAPGLRGASFRAGRTGPGGNVPPPVSSAAGIAAEIPVLPADDISVSDSSVVVTSGGGGGRGRAVEMHVAWRPGRRNPQCSL